MDSAPATSEVSASARAEFGRDLAHRSLPQVTVIRRSAVQPGFIARRSLAFGSYIGQSQVSRWSIGATMQRGALPVRPPIDYWPWATADEPEPVHVPRFERSLPRMATLRRNTDASPGAIVKAMQPQTIDLGQVGQKAPKRNEMESFKAMLERTGHIPPGDGETQRPVGEPRVATESRGVATALKSAGRPSSAQPDGASVAAAGLAAAAAAAVTTSSAPDTVRRAAARPAAASTRGSRPAPAVVPTSRSDVSRSDVSRSDVGSSTAGSATGAVQAADLAAHIQSSRAVMSAAGSVARTAVEPAGTAQPRVVGQPLAGEAFVTRPNPTPTTGDRDLDSGTPSNSMASDASVVRRSVAQAMPPSVSNDDAGRGTVTLPGVMPARLTSSTADRARYRPAPAVATPWPGSTDASGPPAAAAHPPQSPTSSPASPGQPGSALAATDTATDTTTQATTGVLMSSLVERLAPSPPAVGTAHSESSVEDVRRTSSPNKSAPGAPTAVASSPNSTPSAVGSSNTSATTSSVSPGPGWVDGRAPGEARRQRPAAADVLATAESNPQLDQLRNPHANPRPSVAPQLQAIQRSTQVDALDRPARPERPTPDRFLDVLNAASTSSLRPLPSIFAPMAQAVVGRTDVMVRDDSGARAALAAVGKRAATMGNTIVLPDRAGAATDTAVLAHELTHIAHPSPLPRFYADDRPSAEERQADAVAQLIHRSPTLRAATPATPVAPPARQGRPRETAPRPGGSTASPTMSGATPTTLRRSTTPTRPAVSSATTDALSLTPPPPRYAAAPPATPGHPIGAATASRGSRAHRSTAVTVSAETSGGTVRRSGAATQSSTTPRRSALTGAGAGAGAASLPIRRALAQTPDSDVGVSGVQDRNTSSTIGVPIIDNMTTTAGVVEFVDWIVERVEDRVIAELQRRGGRFKEDF